MDKLLDVMLLLIIIASNGYVCISQKSCSTNTDNQKKEFTVFQGETSEYGS